MNKPCPHCNGTGDILVEGATGAHACDDCAGTGLAPGVYEPRADQRIGRHVIGQRCSPACSMCEREAEPAERDFAAVSDYAEKQAAYEEQRTNWNVDHHIPASRFRGPVKKY